MTTEALVCDLLAILRKAAGDPGPLVAARLAGPSPGFSGDAGARDALVAELSELARRARASGATDEELALSLGVLIATSRAAVSP